MDGWMDQVAPVKQSVAYVCLPRDALAALVLQQLHQAVALVMRLHHGDELVHYGEG